EARAERDLDARRGSVRYAAGAVAAAAVQAGLRYPGAARLAALARRASRSARPGARAVHGRQHAARRRLSYEVPGSVNAQGPVGVKALAVPCSCFSVPSGAAGLVLQNLPLPDCA